MLVLHIFVWLLSLVALALLAIITFSTPFITKVYFLHTSQNGGMIYGLLGTCLDNGSQCSPKALGIISPELTFWLTKALVLYPVAASLTLLALLSLIPPLCTYRRDRYFPSPAFTCLAFLAFLSSLVALAFALALFIVGVRRFHALGFEASLGPCIWMSIGAVVALAIVSMSSGCGCVGRSHHPRASPYLAYSI